MTTFLGTLRFTITVHDEDRARTLAQDYLTAVVAGGLAGGATLRSADGSSPEVAIHGVVQDPGRLAVVAAAALLQRGVSSEPAVQIDNVQALWDPVDE
jgi:hypothetical protein